MDAREGWRQRKLDVNIRVIAANSILEDFENASLYIGYHLLKLP